uniref:DUF7081 domain-containing protein n=1 Tax=Nelumbo nucifera TaxID=4432 RepID=A0A822ZYF3_NELNU|nr:TPA_asm: hypothetical protein HUJ06_017813 [Nelumbo nucifera]
MELDIPGEDNGFTAGSKENELHLRPVKAGESGEGLPYAPVDWPNRGDNWTWKVGKRKTSSGFWIDRYLYPPRSLRKTMTLCRKYRFASRYSVEQYIRKEFPNADVNAFFASFSWKVPSEDSTWTKGWCSVNFFGR